jgi:HD-like signal output (HDOD) protein
VTTTLPPREAALRAIDQLPPFSPILTKLMGSLSNDNVSFAELADLIEKDTVLAGNVLRLVNSAFYARRGTVGSVRHAVSLLGLSKLRNITMSLSVARMWNQQKWSPGWVPGQFNLHSVAAAVLADLVATEIDRAEFPEGAFTAGLLQNSGMLLIAMGLPDECPKVRQLHIDTGLPLAQCERRLLDVDHAELSGATCEKWRLPVPIADAVRLHHSDGADPCSLSSIIALADHVVGQTGIHVQEWCRPVEGDPVETLAKAGLGGRGEAVMDAYRAEFDAVRGFFQ